MVPLGTVGDEGGFSTSQRITICANVMAQKSPWLRPNLTVAT